MYRLYKWSGEFICKGSYEFVSIVLSKIIYETKEQASDYIITFP